MTAEQLLEVIAAKPLLTRKDLTRLFCVGTRRLDQIRREHRDFPRPVRVFGPRWNAIEIARWIEANR